MRSRRASNSARRRVLPARAARASPRCLPTPCSVRAPRVNAAMKVFFFRRFENGRLLRLPDTEPQNRRTPNRRMSKERAGKTVRTFDIRRSAIGILLFHTWATAGYLDTHGTLC